MHLLYLKGILLSDHLHPQFSKLMFCVDFRRLFKSVLDVALLYRSAASVCDLHIEGCVCRLLLYETMKHSVFMHMSVLNTAESACVFNSYHTLLLLTPTSLRCALIPPRLSIFPLFTHSFLWGCDLCYTASLYIQHR